MMKILCLVLLVGMFAIQCEAWGPRVRLPRVRIRVPTVRVPSPRLRVPRLRSPRLRLPRLRLPRLRLPRLRLPRLRLPRLRLPRLRVPRLRVPRLRVPRLRLPRLRLPRLRLPRLHLPRLRLRKIKDKAKDAFSNLYKKVCGANEMRSDCDDDLVKRAMDVCIFKKWCLQNFIKQIGKRSIDSQNVNIQPLMNDDVAVPEMSQSKRDYGKFAKLAIKGARLHMECCLKACRDSDIVIYCKADN